MPALQPPLAPASASALGGVKPGANNTIAPDGTLNVTPGSQFQGTWNASTNTPTLVNGTGTVGAYYVATTAGTNLGATFAAGDQAVYGVDLVWHRVPAFTGYGSMSAQNANAVAITGGAGSFAQVGVLSGDVSQASLSPDFPWSIRDSAGNITLFVDYTGTTQALAFIAATATIGSVTVTGSIAAASVAVGGDTLDVAALPPPDWVWPVRDAAGNYVAGFDYAGNLVVPGVIARNAVINGAAFTGTTTPSDAVDVRNASYGAVGDGVQNYGYATVTGSPANTLTITNFSGTVTLSQASATTALLTIVGTAGSGWACQPHHAGAWLYLVVGAYTLLAQVAQYVDGQTLVLTASGVTAQSGASGSLTCPAVTADRIGKTLIVDGMGQSAWWTGGTKMPDTVTPYGTQWFASTITGVAAGNRLTISGTFPFAWSGMPARMLWGTIDTAAAASAAQAAFGAQRRKIHFSGDGALYLLPGICSGDPGSMSYLGQSAVDTGALLNGVIWGGDNAQAFVADAGGLIIDRPVAQLGSDTARSIDRMIFGRATFRRATNLGTINLVISGDSQGSYNPQNQAAAWMQAHKFVEEFRRANPGKIVNVYEMAVGAATWARLANPNYLISDAMGDPVDGWTVPRPIVGSVAYRDFITNLNRTGAGAPILPDVVVFLEGGGNDAQNMDVGSMLALINAVRAVNHGDGFGPPDIVLQTNQDGVINTTTSGNAGGVSIPSAAVPTVYSGYACGVHRSMAVAQGYGCIDMSPLVERACWGADLRRRAMRAIPSVTVTASPAAPFRLPIQCRDFTTWFSLPGSSDAAVWAAMTQLDFRVSRNHGGRAMLRLGTNGNVWLGVSLYGSAVATTCTIANGGTALTVGAATAFAGVTYTQKAGWPQLAITSAPFTSGMNGQCIVAPTGYFQGGVYQPQRNFIRTVLDTSDVLLHDNTCSQSDVVAAVGNVSVGGVQFIPQDSLSQPDVVLFYPDGTIWNTQVAAGGYVSATQATLASAASQALSAASVPAFIGRMGVKWYDTGINMSGQTGTGTWEIDLSRESLMLGYQPAGKTKPSPKIDIFIERFGAAFYPTIIPAASQQIVLNEIWIDEPKSFTPSATPWEIRGIKDANADYFRGGVGGHPGSHLRTDVTDQLYAFNDLSTW